MPFVLLLLSAGSSRPAAAAEPLAAPGVAVEAGAFVVHRADADVVVRRIGVPDPIGIDPSLRTCRVSMGWAEGAWHAALRPGCHPNLADAVTEAAGRWTLEVTPPGRDRELFEFWYVFPEQRGGPVRVLVRQAHDQELVIHDDRVDILDWEIEGIVFPEFPPAAIGQNTERTRCEAKIDISPSGMVGDLALTNCDAVFHADLDRTLRRWRFGSPELDHVPAFSGVTIAVQFQANVDRPDQPGTAKVLFPPDPDLGGRSRGRAIHPMITDPEPNPIPTTPRLFLVDHKSYAEIGVHSMVWPEVAAADRERTCDVLFQVNSQRHVVIWPEACDPSVLDATVLAAQQWQLMHGEIEENERYARFRGTFVFPAGGGPVALRLPAEDLESPVKLLPDRVQTYTEPKAVERVPPKLPDAFASEVLDQVVLCDFDVTVDPRGRPAEVRTRQCPAAYQPYAEKAVRQWRWEPASARGKAIASQVSVRIRFDQG